MEQVSITHERKSDGLAFNIFEVAQGSGFGWLHHSPLSRRRPHRYGCPGHVRSTGIALVAGVGTGKSSTLVLMADATNRRACMRPLIKAIADESLSTVRTECGLWHGAFSSVQGYRAGLSRPPERLGPHSFKGDRDCWVACSGADV
jgi:hypothetical protein